MKRSKVVSRIAGSGVLILNLVILLTSEISHQGWKLIENGLVIFTLLWIIPAFATWISKTGLIFICVCLIYSVLDGPCLFY
jgi:hypothetical protein